MGATIFNIYGEVLKSPHLFVININRYLHNEQAFNDGKVTHFLPNVALPNVSFLSYSGQTTVLIVRRKGFTTSSRL